VKNTNDLILVIVAVLVAAIGITAVIMTKPNPVKPADPEQPVLNAPALPAVTVARTNGLGGGNRTGFGGMGVGGLMMGPPGMGGPMMGPPGMGGGRPMGPMMGPPGGISAGMAGGQPTVGPAGAGRKGGAALGL